MPLIKIGIHIPVLSHFRKQTRAARPEKAKGAPLCLQPGSRLTTAARRPALRSPQTTAAVVRPLPQASQAPPAEQRAGTQHLYAENQAPPGRT